MGVDAAVGGVGGGVDCVVIGGGGGGGGVAVDIGKNGGQSPYRCDCVSKRSDGIWGYYEYREGM